ncbi:hypothetical protein XENOCAPTIV_006301 [Xenoophorus captivus]|uniref:Uncharacterized protein n=1 Tax=Xenoophorus captivus TaxID=1517983 RepID=A0ABV0RXY1_9TELE
MGASYNQQDNLQEAYYTDDVVNLGAEGCEEGEEGYHQEEEEAYVAEFNQDNTEMSEDQIGYTGEPAEGDDGYQYEVLDIEISEPIDGEFQGENETLGDEQAQEESEEEDDEGEESGRIRFKSERKEGAVVRLADSGPSAPPFASKRTTSLPAASPAPDPPSHGSPLPIAATPDGSTTPSNDEFPTA